MFKLLHLLFLLCVFSKFSYSQTEQNKSSTQIDSLSGFDNEAAEKSAISEGFVGKEFAVRMNMLKRSYVFNKYYSGKQINKQQPQYMQSTNAQVAAACNNEDFEQVTTTTSITTINQISGWTIEMGTNMGSTTNSVSYNSCNLLGCCLNSPTAAVAFNVPSGYVDPIIGNCYPIYSVFGTTPGSSAANAANPQIAGGMYGNSFIRINDDDNDYSIHRLTKSFQVTNQNALFQFAFISVFSPGHGCCDAGAFKINIYNGSNQITCPTFTVSAPSTACTNTIANVNYLKVQTCLPMDTSSFVFIFSKWQKSSVDLRNYIGQTISIEVVATDCTAGGHFGYVYFDAQCGPMTVYANNLAYPVNSQSATVPGCSTICAAACLGANYYWNGPNVPLNLTIPSFTNNCFLPTSSGNYTVYLVPPGSCSATPFYINVLPSTNVISGSVTSTLGVVTGSVQLYRLRSTGYAWKLQNTVPISSSSYYFPSVFSGTYAVLAIPNQPGLQPTWGSSGMMWKDANRINFSCGLNSIQNINVLSLDNIGTGTKSIFGTIREGDDYGKKTTTPGNPIGGVVVKGGKNPGGSAVNKTVTNSQGQYTLTGFTNSNPNEDYFVLVDLPGLDTNLTYHRQFSANNTNYSGFDFVADSMLVNPVDLQVGINELKIKDGRCLIYPNPTKNKINIEFELDKAVDIEITLTNLLGKKVKTILPKTFETKNELELTSDLSDLPTGIYFVKIAVGDEERVLKIVLEE